MLYEVITETIRTAHGSGGVSPAARVEGKPPAQRLYLDAHCVERIDVTRPLERPNDQTADFLHLRLAHPARGDRGRSDANSRRHHGLAGIERDHVLVGRDAGSLESDLRGLAGRVPSHQGEQEEVVVGATGDDLEAA